MENKNGREKRERLPAGAPLLQRTSAAHQVQTSQWSASAAQRPVFWDGPYAPPPTSFPLPPSQMMPQGVPQMSRYPSLPGLPQPSSYSFTSPQQFMPKTLHGSFSHLPVSVQGGTPQKLPSYLRLLTASGFLVLLMSAPMFIWFSYFLYASASIFTSGPLAALCSFVGVYVVKWGCKFGCITDATRMMKILKFFCMGGLFFDVIGIVVVPLVMYSIVCPDDEDLNCPHDLPYGQACSVAVALVMIIHGALCILVTLQATTVVDAVLDLYNKRGNSSSFPSSQRYGFRSQAPSLGYHSFPRISSQPTMQTMPTMPPHFFGPIRPL